MLEAGLDSSMIRSDATELFRRKVTGAEYVLFDGAYSSTISLTRRMLSGKAEYFLRYLRIWMVVSIGMMALMMMPARLGRFCLFRIGFGYLNAHLCYMGVGRGCG